MKKKGVCERERDEEEKFKKNSSYIKAVVYTERILFYIIYIKNKRKVLTELK